MNYIPSFLYSLYIHIKSRGIVYIQISHWYSDIIYHKCYYHTLMCNLVNKPTYYLCFNPCPLEIYRQNKDKAVYDF
jgi:hypothetical protein